MKKCLKFIPLLLMGVSLLGGCNNPITSMENNSVISSIKNEDSDLDSMLGDWTMVAYSYHSSYDDDPSDDNQFYLTEDNEWVGTFKVYQEDNKYKADYEFNGDGNMHIYGKTLEKVSGALCDDCTNQEWYVTYFERQPYDATITYTVTMSDADTLELLEDEFLPASEDNDGYDNQSKYYFKRTDSDLESAINAYRYPETYTVSNIQELYDALGSNRKIILKEGTYNFSELPESDSYNQSVNWRYGYDSTGENYDYSYFPEAQAYCYGVKNLILEGEEGADVHICTDSAWVAPLAFESGDHITLRNLKIGHQVEPGMCCGSVTYFLYVYNITIDNCRLYGSGTYGIEAESCCGANVTNCDIYECSYGLVSLSNSSEFYFENDIMRDSYDIEMFNLYEDAYITFKNCEIKNNNSTSYDFEYFIDANDCYGDIVFEDCTFSDNKYYTLSNGDVTFTNCTFDDNK